MKKEKLKWLIPIILISVALAAGVVFVTVLLLKNTKPSVGDIVTFGSYEQDNDSGNGAEPIQWYVMEMAGDEAVLLSVDVLDALSYDDLSDDQQQDDKNTSITWENTSITWENSPLRSWLNDEFYSIAFTGEEKQKIVESHLTNEDNPYYHTSGGKDTTDNVFLLSLGDIEKYFGVSADDWERAIQGTDGNDGKESATEYRRKCYEEDHRIFAYASKYARETKECNVISHETNRDLAQALYDTDLSYADNGTWWILRSPGDDKNYAAIVDNWGSVVFHGSSQITGRGGIRPAIRVKL